MPRSTLNCRDGPGVPLDFQGAQEWWPCSASSLQGKPESLALPETTHPRLLCGPTSTDGLFRGRTPSPWQVSWVQSKLCLLLMDAGDCLGSVAPVTAGHVHLLGLTHRPTAPVPGCMASPAPPIPTGPLSASWMNTQFLSQRDT